MSTELAERAKTELMPAFTIEGAIERYNSVLDFTKRIMKPGKDYGVIPGTGKPTLLKPGAEKLCSFFGLGLDYQEAGKLEDWQAGFFFYAYKAVLSRNGQVIATGIGSCNSREKKYRWRAAERKCPKCGKPTIINGKAEYGGGYICFAKKGGCGAKFKVGDQAIEAQPSGLVENTEPFDLVNTIQKMAQKRALIAATLVAANASEFYTQDVEDMEFIDGEIVEPAVDPPPAQQQQPTRTDSQYFAHQQKAAKVVGPEVQDGPVNQHAQDVQDAFDERARENADVLADNLRWRQELAEAFNAMGFTEGARVVNTKNVLKNRKLKSLDDVVLADRHEWILSVTAGKFDPETGLLLRKNEKKATAAA